MPITDYRIFPWIVPEADERLKDWVCAKGVRILLKPREILLQESRTYGSLFFVESGVIGQGVVNSALYTKPMAMNLFTAGRLMGILNIFTGVASPRRLVALTPTVVYAYPHEKARVDLNGDFALYQTLAAYGELSAKSELQGMEVLFTLGPEHRLAMYFTAMLLSENRIDTRGRILVSDSQAPTETMVELPYVLTRETIRNVIYLSRVTFDRLFGDWMKNRWFVRDDAGRAWVDVRQLDLALEWVRLH